LQRLSEAAELEEHPELLRLLRRMLGRTRYPIPDSRTCWAGWMDARSRTLPCHSSTRCVACWGCSHEAQCGLRCRRPGARCRRSRAARWSPACTTGT